MTDLISRADAIKAVQGVVLDAEAIEAIKALPSAELTLQTPQTYGKGINPSNAEVVEDLISRADAIEAVCDGCVWYKTASCEEGKEEWECSEVNKIRHLPSADAVSREFYEDAVKANIGLVIENRKLKEQIESADAEPKMTEKVREALSEVRCNDCKWNDDVVEVVRCKDCRHRDLFSCPLADNDFQKDEDFCSWGERREE